MKRVLCLLCSAALLCGCGKGKSREELQVEAKENLQAAGWEEVKFIYENGHGADFYAVTAWHSVSGKRYCFLAQGQYKSVPPMAFVRTDEHFTRPDTNILTFFTEGPNNGSTIEGSGYTPELAKHKDGFVSFGMELWKMTKPVLN